MIGKKLLHYEITEKLGEGGMGVVYKARDTHLDRFVAIKVLPAERVADATRKARFVQEAKAASALNHPNIVVVHDISSDAGVDFIAMEYVAGKTLDQLIPRKGMRLNDALKIAVQIADALARAHSAGIIHRDLKPANIMVDGHGQVKVLDFGLAKLTEQGATSEDAATETIGVKTDEGAIVGTAAYMSPEQAEGKPLDARSDIFSFGAVLYEMITGQRAFRGDSKMSTLSAVLHKEPAPIPADVPRELQRIAVCCLRKDPERRFQHTGDVKVALLELREQSESGGLDAPVRPHGREHHVRHWISAVALLLGLGAPAAYWLSTRPAAPPETVYRAVPFTDDTGSEKDPAFSPEGNQIAYSWDGDTQDNFDIYVRLTGAGMGRPLRITNDPAPDYSPAFSPDGRMIAFLRDVSAERAALYLVPALGGVERRLADIEDLPRRRMLLLAGRYLAWTPDGKWLAVSKPAPNKDRPTYRLVLVSADNGAIRPLTSPGNPGHSDADPAFSPDGKHLGFVRGSVNARAVYVVPLSGDYRPEQEPKRLTDGIGWVNGVAWTPDCGEIIYSAGFLADQALWRVPVSGSGAPRRVNWVGELGFAPALTRLGTRLAYQRHSEDKDLWRLELSSAGAAKGEPKILIASTSIDDLPDYSPDSARIAFSSLGSGSYEIWVADAGGANRRAVTAIGRGSTLHPAWSPDGKSIAFQSNIEGQMELYVVGVDGGTPHRLTAHPAQDQLPQFSRDGRWIYFTTNRSGTSEVWKVPSAGGEPLPVSRSPGSAPRESPDGRFVYFVRSRPGGTSGIWRVATGGGQPEEILEFTGRLTCFRVVKEGIYFVAWPTEKPRIELSFFRFASRTTSVVAELGTQSYPSFCVSPDGHSIVHTSSRRIENDIMLVENFR